MVDHISHGAAPCSHSQYEVSDDQDSVQMLQRSTQVGEFYRMSPPAVFDAKESLPPSYMGKPRPMPASLSLHSIALLRELLAGCLLAVCWLSAGCLLAVC